RDAAAMQAKLDELIRALKHARPQFIGIEHLTDIQIEAIRQRLEDDVGCTARIDDGAETAEETVERLLDRT
ncbi:MAG: low affinity iron permease family protein, partial [Croceibacterium sp.]